MEWEIIDKLKYYNKQVLIKQTEEKKLIEISQSNLINMETIELKGKGTNIEDIINGETYKDEEGQCFVIENRYPLTYFYGGCCLGDAVSNIDNVSLKRLYPRIDTCGITIDKFLFLDIETTGLSSGVGTVAFLVGIGFFESDCFVIRQYFMRDYDEEITMLNALNSLFKSYNGFITFNGKSFDLNIIKTRYAYNRLKTEFDEEELIHIDLLFLSRKIWGGMLESCALSSLEENILGEMRIGDIPGALIPQVYFEYLILGDAREIKKVVKHNELDILAMVALLNKISNMVNTPALETNSGYELIGVGKILETAGEIGMVVDCLKECAELDDSTIKSKALKKLSLIYKSEGNYVEAIKCWDVLANSMNYYDALFALIEMAKYYEHKEKCIVKAIEITERALQLFFCMKLENVLYEFELKKRLERLKRKLKN